MFGVHNNNGRLYRGIENVEMIGISECIRTIIDYIEAMSFLF